MLAERNELADHDRRRQMIMSSPEAPDVRSELVRRHTATARTVLALLIGVALLCVVAYLSKKFLIPKNNSSLDMAVRISILIFGLSSIALRRTKFSACAFRILVVCRDPSG